MQYWIGVGKKCVSVEILVCEEFNWAVDYRRWIRKFRDCEQQWVLKC